MRSPYIRGRSSARSNVIITPCAVASLCTSPMVSRTTSLILRRINSCAPVVTNACSRRSTSSVRRACRDNIGQGRARFLQIRRVEGEQTPCRLGVAKNCRQGLLDLVCQSSEFPQAVGSEVRPQFHTLLLHTSLLPRATNGSSTAGHRVLSSMGAVRMCVHISPHGTEELVRKYCRTKCYKHFIFADNCARKL